MRHTTAATKEVPAMRVDLMDDIRGTYGLEDGDTSMDEHINQLPAISKLRLVCQWNLGDKEWAHVFVGWARSCGLTITGD